MSETSLLLTQALTVIPSFILWLSLAASIGMALAYASLETIAYLTHDAGWEKISQWSRSLLKWLLIASAGSLCITAIPIATNWLPFWTITPILSFFPLFLLEIILVVTTIALAILVEKGEQRLSPRSHLTAIWLMGIFMGFSLWIPVSVMTWLEWPQESWVSFQDLSIVVSSPWCMAFSTLGALKFLHLITCSWVIGGGVLIACCLTRTQERIIAKRTAIIGISLVLTGGVLTLCLGDSTGYSVACNQPMKMAAMQQLDKGQRQAPLVICGSIRIPEMLSRLATHNNNGFVPGISDIVYSGYTTSDNTPVLSVLQKTAQASKANTSRRKDSSQKTAEWEAGKRYWGYLQLTSPTDSVPNSTLLFVAFRIMVGGGFLLLLLAIIQIAAQVREELQERRLIRWSGMAIVPLALLCSLCGWYVSIYGMYPWAVSEILTVSSAVSALPIGLLAGELLLVLALCTLWMVFIGKKLKKANQLS